MARCAITHMRYSDKVTYESTEAVHTHFALKTPNHKQLDILIHRKITLDIAHFLALPTALLLIG